MVRQPAVAGLFYPKDKEQLRSLVRKFLEQSKETNVEGELKALIVPHAGYVYSGIVAAAGFKLLKNKTFKKIILLGPSHQVYFTQASLSTEDWQTPLGNVKVGQSKEWLKEDLIVDFPPAHQQEHCLEVEVPFLQEVLKDLQIYPLVVGDVEEKELAETLSKFLNQDTFLIVSSDLSHYLPYDQANKKDQETINKILNFDFTKLDACGEKPIKVLMHLAQKFKWQPTLIDYKNSGDTAGEKSRVVGYATIAYTK